MRTKEELWPKYGSYAPFMPFTNAIFDLGWWSRFRWDAKFGGPRIPVRDFDIRKSIL